MGFCFRISFVVHFSDIYDIVGVEGVGEAAFVDCVGDDLVDSDEVFPFRHLDVGNDVTHACQFGHLDHIDEEVTVPDFFVRVAAHIEAVFSPSDIIRQVFDELPGEGLKLWI